MSNRQAFALAPASLTDALYESVRRRIINEELKPGEKVTEARLTSEYGVARPTAKACVERLVVVGLLRRSAHKTAVVPELSQRDIVDLFLSRETVESAAVRILAREARVPEPASRAQRALETATSGGNYEEIVAADIAFHAALVRGTASERLSRMHELILGEVELTMGLFSAHKAASRESIPAEHAAILAAILAGDEDAAGARLSEHLHAARTRVLALASNSQS
ncbi:GntR family transcriptional regulator [Jiangella anatolica]|uniref:GntR family transcriptional regulator n=1 Tax=Jiangella anatolica TaxID=2670374 RepID=UPI0018F79E76|nr:GntR family transcriptional regulator [Jiangella anatolica]